ncbi:conserved unknown protein [Ectocarpus siliculosus]|uniref:Sodium/calcium exchanger membrane region domain-containing protein n=1 Tax=Ectocarpus siliculosus TaxID=2880 RepID=D7G0Z1_ECTSI|nr:conserved unknown protein [Ectocarpus siliculosus]|eukprot:CBJ33101.1 conserved unknown protein [Ectocarpus siliculosus]
MNDDSDSVSWGYIPGYFGLFLAVIYLMCHTADNYFSPVLAVMCDLLDMPPEVAGVTFLAFGNGAPDVFSAFVALTSSADREDGLLVGMGSLLGSTISTVTLVVGSVVYIKPTGVPPVPFARDVVFLVLALVLVVISDCFGEISLWLAACYLALYGVYVTMVLKGRKGEESSRGDANPRQDGEGGGVGEDDHAVDARWIGVGSWPLSSAEKERAPRRPNPSNPDFHFSKGGGNGAEGGTVTVSGDDGGGHGSVPNSCKTPPNGVNGGRGSSGHGSNRRGHSFDSAEKGLGGRPAAARDDFSARGNSVKHDYFGGEGVGEEGRSLLGGGGDGVGSGGESWGLDGEAEENVFAMVPGSTASMFSEEDDSAASWLAQRQRQGRSTPWRIASSEYGASEDMSIPLLQDKSWQNGSRNGGGRGIGSGGGPVGATEGDGGGPGSSSLLGRRFEHTWATIQWKQWRLRRRVRRGLDNSYVANLPWYRRVFWALELPFILVRNATIPPVEADSWSQAQAAISTALAPTLVAWAFGAWGTDILWGLTCGWVALLGGLPAGVAVWLTTHKRRMPEERWYRLSLALLSFLSCVAWIYYFADLAVTLIDEIGTATGIPGSILGLTLLAWGNSTGDLVTNLAVAKAGFPGMAIAGSYGGPLFNVLLGVGMPMFYSSARYYPDSAVFELDSSTLFTVVMVIFVLLGTLPVVARSGYHFPPKAPVALLGAYAVYMIGAVWLTVTFKAY